KSGKIRRKAFELSCGWTVESWRLGGRPGKFAGRNSVWLRYRCLLPAKNRGAVVCVLAARQRFVADERSVALSNRQRHLDKFRFLAPARGADEEPLSWRGRKTVVRSAEQRSARCARFLRERSRASRAVSSSPRRYDLSGQSSRKLVHLARAGSAICR